MENKWQMVQNSRNRVFGLLRVIVEGGRDYRYKKTTTDSWTVTVSSPTRYKCKVRGIAFEFTPFSPEPQQVTVSADGTPETTSTPILFNNTCFSHPAVCDKTFTSCTKADMLKVVDTEALMTNCVTLANGTAIISDASSHNANDESTAKFGAYTLTMGVSSRPAFAVSTLTDTHALSLESGVLKTLEERLRRAEEASERVDDSLEKELTDSVPDGLRNVIQEIKRTVIADLDPRRYYSTFDATDESEEDEIGGMLQGAGEVLVKHRPWGGGCGGIVGSVGARASLATSTIDASAKYVSSAKVVHFAKLTVSIDLAYDEEDGVEEMGSPPSEPCLHAALADILTQHFELKRSCEAKEMLVASKKLARRQIIRQAWEYGERLFSTYVQRYILYCKESARVQLAGELGCSVVSVPPFSEQLNWAPYHSSSEEDNRVYSFVKEAVCSQPHLKPFADAGSAPLLKTLIAAVSRISNASIDEPYSDWLKVWKELTAPV
jgi:hypothetical protein